MHTTEIMTSEDFSFLVDGKKASIEDIFPNFNGQDRIGIVVNETAGSAGAGALIMASIARFYDFYRSELGDKPDQLWIYPDFFAFHVGQYHMDHFWMDFWPAHKEVLVEDDPEQILEAINDRGITRLLVEDKDPIEALILKETLGSAKKRILTSLAYSPSGRTKNSNIEVTGCLEAENCINESLDNSKEIPNDDVRIEIKKRRESLYVNNNIVESFRKIELDDAVNMLTKSNFQSEKTKKYLSMSSCN